MPALRHLRMLTKYNAWANQRLLQTLAQLPAAELGRPRATLFGSILHTLNHNYVVDLIWQAHLLRRPHGFVSRNPETTPTLAELDAGQSALDRWYVDYAAALKPSQCDEELIFEFVDGGSGRMRRGDILLHIVNHKNYHRGFVADMLYQLPATPPVTDLPVYLRDAHRED